MATAEIQKVREGERGSLRSLACRIGGDGAVKADDRHARGADPVAVVSQRRQRGAAVVLRDGFAQRIVEGKDLHVVADALREHVELTHEDLRGCLEPVLTLLDEVGADDPIGEEGGETLDCNQRHNEQERETLPKTEGGGEAMRDAVEQSHRRPLVTACM